MIGGRACGLDARGAALACGLVIGFASGSAATPGLDLIEVRPGYFSPNGDGTLDTASLSFVPRGAADSVTVRVEVLRDSDSALMDTLLPAGPVPVDSTVVTSWDPGVTAADGLYRFEILVVDGPDSLVERAYVTADITPPTLQFGTIGPNPFDPAADPPTERRRVPLTGVGGPDDETVVIVFNQARLPVDTLGVFVGPGDSTYVWDGRNSSGTPLASGLYWVNAAAVDLAGNAAVSERAFVLDGSAPQFTDPSPGTIETAAFPVTLSGSVTDDDVVVSVLASFDAGSTFVAVDSASVIPADSVAWAVVVTDAAPVPSFRNVLVRARDAQGHTADVTYRIAYDNPFPVADSTVVSGDTPVPDGGTVELRSYWNRSGLTVTANFSALDSGWIAGEETVVEITPGVYRIRYGVSASNTRLPGGAVVAVDATTGFVSGSDSVTVVLEDRGPQEHTVSIDRNAFDPDAGDRVTIVASSAGVALEVEIWNIGGSRVRRLLGTGVVTWDGRSEEGNVAASGVYFLRVKAGDEEELRKVAITRGAGS